MKKLLLLSLFLCGCSAAYRQRKAIEKLDELAIQQPNEFARLSNTLNPCFSSKAKSDTVINTHTDTLVQDGKIDTLVKNNTVYITKTVPIKTVKTVTIHDTIADGRANKALLVALAIKSDSVTILKTQLSKAEKETNTWRWAAIIAILIIFGYVVFKVVILFNGGWVKKLITILLVFMAFGLKAQNIDATYVKALEAKYPTVKSSFCKSCKLWVNPYFKAIVDTVQRGSVVTYGYFDRHKDSLVTALKVPRTGIYASWHPADGFQNEDKFYNDINKGISASADKYAKGHYCAWILCAWSVDGAILSNTYDFNEGIEVQAQNEGTELQVEFLTRALVGNKSAAAKMHYTGAIYDKVDFWKGSWGSKRVFNVDGISKNYSSVYWNLIKYGNQVHAYWFPNDNTATAKVGYQHYEISVNDLVKRLGFDPQKTLN